MPCRDGIHEYFAEAGGNGSHAWLDTAWQLFLDLADTLINQLPGPVDVGAILENHGNLGQAVTGNRTCIVEAWNARHRCFNRKRDTLFGFERRIAGCLGIDLNLYIGYVRDGINRQLLIVIQSQNANTGHRYQYQPAMLERRAD